ncbi:unnamed protein product, partial [Musa hybrid cultivar]
AHLAEAGDGLHPGAGLEHQVLVVHGAAWRLPNPRGHGAGGRHGDEEGWRSNWDLRGGERPRDDTHPNSVRFGDAFVNLMHLWSQRYSHMSQTPALSISLDLLLLLFHCNGKIVFCFIVIFSSSFFFFFFFFFFVFVFLLCFFS